MSARLGLLFAVVFLIISCESVAASVWNNTYDGFGASFPDEPVRTGTVMSHGRGYSYQSSKRFSKGAALYAITVVEVSPAIARTKPIEFLKAVHAEFVRTMGSELGNSITKQSRFGDGRKRLNYEIDFVHSGALLKGYGFWIIDNNRAIRVSVVYSKSIGMHEAQEVVSFLDTFVLLGNQK